ncbi:SMC family ATPase [Streptomyces niveus]|uniref:SMC family ATPase n=1 Tax=Streptomyces niveus TaxID=193462 RepID=UPI00344146F6
MITPVRVRVRNIRSVADGEIHIPPTGITALHGPIGSGKSTFLSAMVWALYGEVPGGFKQADMRRTGADVQRCEAEVEFLFNGQRFIALRGLRRRSTRGTVREEAYARWWVNGATGEAMAERQISPTKLTMKITELTGLTGRAYTGAFFIAQGELTGLADGTPAQVQALFEEQTGLSELTKKVEEKNTEARRAEQKAATMPGSREETEETRMVMDQAQQEVVSTHEALQRASEEETAAARTLRGADEHANVVERKRRSAEQARVDQARAGERVHQCQERVRSLVSQIDQAGTSAGSPKDLDSRLRELRSVAGIADQAISRAAEAQRHAADAEAAAEQIKREVNDLADPELARRLQVVRQEVTECEQRLGVLRGEYSRLARALTALKTAATCCPTCQQPVHDARTLVAGLKEDLNHCLTQGHTAKTSLEVAQQTYASLHAQWENGTRARARLETARDNAAAVRERATSALKAAREHITTLASFLNEPLPEGDPQDVLDHARATMDDLARNSSQAKHVQNLRAEAASAVEALTAAKAHLDTLNASTATVASDDVSSAAEVLVTARTEHTRFAAARAEANTRFQVASERAKVLTNAHTVAHTRMRKKADQLHQAHILHTAAALLAALRHQLLGEYTAAVSQAATEVLTQITDRHIRFEIDETFTPRVHTAEGTVRPTRVLSGGEKATAALAFRLGVTEQITGGNATGMIIADEITAAHDADTRRAVLACLGTLGWPALVISHGEEITETAQQVISLSQFDESTGTVVATAT